MAQPGGPENGGPQDVDPPNEPRQSGLAVEFSQLYFASDGSYQRSHYLVATALLALGIAIARGLRRTPKPA